MQGRRARHLIVSETVHTALVNGSPRAQTPGMVSIDLTGKTALITGGGQGLGKATATTLHHAGATVVINYFDEPSGQNRERAAATAAALGERASIAAADIRDPAQVDAMIAEIGSLDIVINNAGVIRDRSLKKMTHNDWQTVIDTNLTGVFNVCKAASATLNEGGRIVSLASISGAVGFFGQANYSAAKAGVVGLTKAISKELARRRITVNAVAPGVVLTEMGESIPKEARAKMLEQIPLNCFGEPEDIANAILFLCSDLAGYITGQTIHVNGGWYG